MGGSSILVCVFFGTLTIHGLIFIIWSCGGIKIQKTYLVLFWLGVIHTQEAIVLSKQILATGFSWNAGVVLYNLNYIRIFLGPLIYPLIFTGILDFNIFYCDKFQFFRIKKVLSLSNYVIFVILWLFYLVFYWELSQMAENDEIVVQRPGSLVLYQTSERIALIDYWDITWCTFSLVQVGVLRIWTPCIGLCLSLTFLLFARLQLMVLPIDIGLYLLAFGRTLTLLFMMLSQQKLAHRDINDRGYEVHQAQFNAIYRRLPQQPY